MSSPANEFCKVPNTDALIPRWVSYFITSGFVKKWQISQDKSSLHLLSSEVPMQVWYPLDSSLPAAVRMSFLLFASFAAAGGKARKQLYGRALLVARRP